MDVVLLSPGRLPAGLAGLDAEHVRTGDGAVLPERRFDIAVACSWEATAHLFAVDATRHAFWVDGFAHHRLGAWQAERIAAAIAYDLPTDFLAWGPWVAEALAALRPDARVVALRPGVAAAPARGLGASIPGPLRICVDDAWLPDGAPSEAEAVLAAMAEPHVRADAPARADVLLTLDSVDGVLGLPLQAAALGCVPIVVAGAGGAGDLVEHLRSGICAEPDDLRGTARWLDLLARDRDLLAELGAGAQAAAATFPTPEEATAQLHAALGRLVAEPPPEAQRWPHRLMGDAMAAVAVLRNDHHVLAGELRRAQADEGYVLAQKLRRRLGSPRLAPLRPALRAARRRLT